MPIQFRCPSCSQPIEVDDEFARREAQCPYCRRVITVPAESTFDSPGVVTARASDNVTPSSSVPGVPPPPPPPAYRDAPYLLTPAGEGLHVGPSPYRKERVAHQFGNWALVCTVVAMLCFALFFFDFVRIAADELNALGARNPSPEELNKATIAAVESVSKSTLSRAGLFAAAFAGMVGISFSITSLAQGTKNWKAIVALVLCVVCSTCTCLSLANIVMGSGIDRTAPDATSQPADDDPTVAASFDIHADDGLPFVLGARSEGS